MKLAKTFRLPPELIQRLERHARRNRRSLTSIVEHALDKHLADAEEGAAVSGGAGPAPSSASREVDLAGWLSERLGRPRALCVSYLKSGRVTVDGEGYRGETVDREAVGQVRLDGDLVVDREAGWAK